MAKKPTRKEKIALQQQDIEEETQEKPVKVKVRQEPDTQRSLRRTLAFIVAALAFILYANTLGHQWALDDYSLIKENTQTKSGNIKEILSSTYRTGYFNPDYQLYRPLSKVFFAYEWSFSENDPKPGHFMNIFMYALTGFLLFYMLSLYLKGDLLISFLVSSLFIAHPIHTEVGANIKSHDEILCFLFFVVTAIFTYKFLVSDRVVLNSRAGIFKKLSASKPANLVLAGLSFFLCLLSKESGITFLAVIPLMIWFFTDEKSAKNITATLCLAGVAAIFFMIRAHVLNEARGGSNIVGETAKIDNMMSGLGIAKRFPTAILIMGMYLKTFFFPHPLVSDKSFREIEVVDFGDKWFLLSFLAYAALTAYAVMRFRKKDPIAFGIIYFFITASVASNIVMVIGTNYGERLMYAPSFGFCLAIGVLIAKYLRPVEVGNKVALLGDFFKKYSKAIAVLAVIFVLYSFKTVTRNVDWYDNLTLYEKDIRTAPLSARTHFYLGNYMSQDDFLKENAKDSVTKNMYLDSALSELRRSTKIYPEFGDAWQQIGKIYLNKKDFKTAAENYEKAIAINPKTPIYHNNYGNVLFSVGRYDDARREFSLAVECNPGYSDAYGNLGAVYGTLGENFAKQGKQQEAAQNFQLAIVNYQKVTELEPDKSMPYYFISITYKSLGNEAEAQRYMGLYNNLKQQGK